MPRTYGCAVEFSLELLGGKWKSVILARLKQQPMRYGELRRVTPRLSDKMLSQRLRELGDLGLIETTADGRYALSAHGEELRPVLQALYDWGSAAAPRFGAVIRDTEG